jgi:hypothetical protein
VINPAGASFSIHGVDSTLFPMGMLLDFFELRAILRSIRPSRFRSPLSGSKRVSDSNGLMIAGSSFQTTVTTSDRARLPRTQTRPRPGPASARRARI